MAKKISLNKPKKGKKRKTKEELLIEKKREILHSGDAFTKEIISIFEDSFDFSEILLKNIKGSKLPQDFLKDLDLSDLKVTEELNLNPEFRKAHKEYKSFTRSHDNLFNSLFIWMWITFERNMFKLITCSYQQDLDFKRRYKTKFNEEDFKRAKDIGAKESRKKKGGKPSGRFITNEYIFASKRKQEKIELSHISDVLGNEKIGKYAFLFHDGNWHATKKGRKLKKFYDEMRERRNLFSHRGYIADKDYIQRTGEKGHKIFNNTKEVKDFYERGFFSVKHAGKETPEKIIEGETNLNCTPNYFIHCFIVLIQIYTHYFSYSLASINKNQGEPINLSAIHHELLISSLKLRQPFQLIAARNILNSYFEEHLDSNLSKVDEVDLINYCLARKELNKYLSAKSRIDLKKIKPYIELTKRNSLDDVYRMGLAFINDDLESGYTLLESLSLEDCDKTDFHEWFIFKDLYKKKKFQQIYKKKFKETFKPLDKGVN